MLFQRDQSDWFVGKYYMLACILCRPCDSTSAGSTRKPPPTQNGLSNSRLPIHYVTDPYAGSVKHNPVFIDDDDDGM